MAVLKTLFEQERGESPSSTADQQYRRTVALCVDLVRQFARSAQHWRRRQTYAYVCRELITQRPIDAKIFDDYMKKPLLELAQDDRECTCVATFVH